MTPIPAKLKKEILADPAYKSCMLHGHQHHVCDGRITFEHVIIYGGKQVQEKWAIIPLCARAHAVDGYQDAGTMRKELNVWIALNRATDAELRAKSKAVDYIRERERLNKKYGIWEQRFPLDKAIENLGENNTGKPVQVLLPIPKRSRFLPTIETQKALDDIRGMLVEAEGRRYRDEEIIGMAIRSLASELEAARQVVS